MKINKTAQDLINQLMAKHPHTILTIGILHKGKTSFKLFNQTGEIPYQSHLYEMGSIGKTFTTSLLAKFVAEGKMDLDESVVKYLPELDDEKYYPTLRRLATHTAGYPEDYEAEDLKLMLPLLWRMYVKREQLLIQDVLAVSKEKLIRFAKKRDLKDEDYPWVYSNFGMALLGLAISNVAGTDFMTVMTEFIQQDLKLTNTFVGTNTDQLIQGYDLKNREITPWIVTKDEQYIPAGGGMITTAEDLLTYARLNLAETPAYLTVAHEYQAKGQKDSGMDMALGWWLNVEEKVLWHGGNTSGFATSFGFSKEKDFALVILANTQDFAERQPIFNAVLTENWDD